MKTPLVLISGWARPVATLEPWAQMLRTSFDVLSIRDAAPLDSDDFLQSALPPSYILAGWSLGGMLALEAALRQPQKVRGLVLIGTAARFCSGSGQAEGTAPAVLRAMIAALPSLPRAVLTEVFRLTAAPFEMTALELEAQLEAALALGVPHLQAGLRLLLQTDLRDRLPALDVPTFVLHGEQDRIMPSVLGRALADVLPQARLTVFERIGHDLPLRAAGQVTAAMREFEESL